MSPATFSIISTSRPDLVGGGGVEAEIFRDIPKANRFGGGGGGGSSIFFSAISNFPVAAGLNQSNSLNSGTFFYISG